MKPNKELLEALRTQMSELVGKLPFEAVFMIATPTDVLISSAMGIVENRKKARDTYVNATTTLAKNLIDTSSQASYDEKIKEYRDKDDEDDEKPIWMR